MARQQFTLQGGLAVVLLVGIVLLSIAPSARAQEETDPVVATAHITVDHAEDGTSSVEATFELVGVGEEGIEHLLVHRRGIAIQDVSIDGEAIDVAAQADGISRVAGSVSGEEVSYTVTYTVSRDEEAFTVPILGPEVPRDASDRAVTIEVLLPPGMVLSGEVFPSLDRRETRDGREVVVHRVINVPSVVVTEYGERGRFSLSDWTTAIALVLFAALVALWYRQSLTGRTSE